MFKFLKEKLRGAIEKFSKKAEEEIEEKPEIKEEKIEEVKKEPKEIEEKPAEKIEEAEEEVKEKKGFFKKIKEKFRKEKPVEKIEEIKEEKPVEKKGIFEKIKEKITTVKLSRDKFDELFNDLELALLENNVAVEVIEKIKEDLSNKIVEKQIKRNKLGDEIKEALKSTLNEILESKNMNLIEEIKNKQDKPYVIVFVGVNGAGKTTTIAKVVNLFIKNDISCVISASDTWRASAIQQIEEHGKKLGVKVIKHDYKADPAAVAFDAIKHARSKNIDVVLIDTAGRQHSNINLMDEMKKIIRVAKPNLKIFIAESIVGNDAVEQAQQFNQAIDLDAIILAKADIDEKGGAAISVGYVTKKPILYLGTGQSYDDLEEFDKNKIISSIGL